MAYGTPDLDDAHIESPDRDAQGVPCQKRGFPKASVASGLRVSGCGLGTRVGCPARLGGGDLPRTQYIHAKMTRVWGTG